MTAGNNNGQPTRRRRLGQIAAAAAALALFASARSLPADAPDTAEPAMVTVTTRDSASDGTDASRLGSERPGAARESGDRPPDRLPQPDH